MAAKTEFIQNKKTGKMAGSVGVGRDNTPVAAVVAIDPTTGNPVEQVDLAAAAKALKPKLTAEQKLANAEANLLAAIEAMSTEEGFKAALDFAASVPGYSFGNNSLLLWEHMHRRATDPSIPADPGLFMSFNRWKEHGRSVVKGATGYPILAPKTVTSRWYMNGNARVYLKKGEHAPAGREEFRGQGVTGFTVVYTFPEYLTEGEPIPQMPKPKLLEGETLPGLDDVVEDLITEQGFTLEWVNRDDDPLLRGGANGYTEYLAKRIVVCADLPSDRARTKTLLHEYGHLVMHGRDGEAHSEHGGIKEVQAEATAYLVFKTLADIDTSDYSVPYTSGWLSSVTTDPAKRLREAQRAINAMGKVATAVIDAYQGAQLLAGDDTDPDPAATAMPVPSSSEPQLLAA